MDRWMKCVPERTLRNIVSLCYGGLTLVDAAHLEASRSNLKKVGTNNVWGPTGVPMGLPYPTTQETVAPSYFILTTLLTHYSVSLIMATDLGKSILYIYYSKTVSKYLLWSLVNLKHLTRQSIFYVRQIYFWSLFSELSWQKFGTEPLCNIARDVPTEDEQWLD